MGAPKRIKDFTADATVSDTDRFPVDSAVDGTRAVPALDVRTYMQTGLSAGFVNPMTSVADIIVGGTAGAAQRLAKGTALQVLRVNAGATALEYATPAGGASPTYLTHRPWATAASGSVPFFRIPMPANGYWMGKLWATFHAIAGGVHQLRFIDYHLSVYADGSGLQSTGPTVQIRNDPFIQSGTFTTVPGFNSFLEDPVTGFINIDIVISSSLSSPVIQGSAVLMSLTGATITVL